MNPDDPETAVAFLNGIGGCLTAESLVAHLSGQFANEPSIDPATARCISEALVGHYGGTELLQNFAASADGSLSADFEAAVTQAAPGCVTAGAVGGGIAQQALRRVHERRPLRNDTTASVNRSFLSPATM